MTIPRFQARFIRSLALCASLVLPVAAPTGASAQTSPTAFNYQGRLTQGVQSFTGTADLTFTLFDAESGGSVVAGPLTLKGVQVQAGLFNAIVDFGVPSTGGGSPRWLEISATAPSFGGSPVTVSPRQPIGSVPGAAVAFAVPVYSGSPFVPFKGAVRFNDASNDFEGHNGLFWVSLTGRTAPAFNTALYTAPGTVNFTVPAGITLLYAEAWGAGGGGGGCINVTPSCASSEGSLGGGGGGAGGYAASVLTVTPGEVLTLVVGAGGELGVNSNFTFGQGSPGETGGASAILRESTELLRATGGGGGAGAIWAGMDGNCNFNAPGLVPGGAGGAGTVGAFSLAAGAPGTLGGIPLRNCTVLPGNSWGFPAGPPINCCFSGAPGLSGLAPGSAFATAGLPGALPMLSTIGKGGVGAVGKASCSGTTYEGRSSDPGQPGSIRLFW